ncbi:MAG: hypothetical protein ATN35_03475 [Epulopiscium sp. Nele67-Bin004]|nr:MAG: hypothetical protein ATN35_03475 [Epulopiscium sp. Nele67-Bin004]
MSIARTRDIIKKAAYGVDFVLLGIGGETLAFISTITRTPELMELENLDKEVGGMCTSMQRFKEENLNKGRAEGIEQGIEQGREERSIKIAINL